MKKATAINSIYETFGANSSELVYVLSMIRDYEWLNNEYNNLVERYNSLLFSVKDAIEVAETMKGYGV